MTPLEAYRAISREHREFRHLIGPQVLTALERKFNNDREMTCAEVERIVTDAPIASLICAKIRGPRVEVRQCPKCERFIRANTAVEADARLAAHVCEV